MTTLTVHHSVADYEVWKSSFDEHEKVRRSHGATGHRVLRDGKDLLVLIDFPDVAGAQAFAADPSLKDAMSAAGVTSTPEVNIRTDASDERY
jgi:hypothetical protein